MDFTFLSIDVRSELHDVTELQEPDSSSEMPLRRGSWYNILVGPIEMVLRSVLHSRDALHFLSYL